MQYHHIFFHSLVVEPEKAFCKENDSVHNFETWMITVDEYNRLLESLYERNYMLVHMADLLHDRVRLPENKIPLVISYDDVNYYDYMKGYGFADKIVVTEDGSIANQWTESDGSKTITTQADGIAILESFIKLHPDFSYHNARGIIAITGYEGILGYHNLEEEKEELAKVVSVLKEHGWEFACHSYGHKRSVFKDEGADEALCIEDTRLWLEKIAPIVGATNIYISPFGIKTKKYSRFEQYLKENGFQYFCDVNNTRQFEQAGQCFYFPRVNIDGYLFKHRGYEFETYYGELRNIIDSHRQEHYPLCTNSAAMLAQHARVCLKLPTVYLWGGLGEIITEEVIEDRQKAYPEVYTPALCEELRMCIGKNIYGFDCSGLIKNFIMGGLFHYKYDPAMDLNSAMMREAAKETGEMDTLPEQPGVCLYMPGHVGIYMGNREVIESTSNPKFGNGVVKTSLSDRKWTHWFRCPGIEY